MGLFGTGTRSRSNRTNRSAMPSREEVNRRIEETKTEMRTEERNPDPSKPGPLKRFANWISGLFSKDKQNLLDEGATMRGNASAASAPQAAIGDTVEPAVIDEGVTEPTAAADAAFTVRSEPIVSPENGAVNAGNITFTIDEHEEGYAFSNKGTVKVLGKDVAWTAADRISITTNDNTSYFGSGTISFTDPNLVYTGNANVLLMDNKAKFIFDTEVSYIQNDIKIKLDNEFDDLNEIKLKEVTLLSPLPENDSKFAGDVTLGSEGFVGSAEKDVVTKPPFIKDERNFQLSLHSVGGVLGFHVFPDDNCLSVGPANVAELRSGVLNVSVDESGAVIYHVPEDYRFMLFGGKYIKEFKLPIFDLAANAQGISELTVPAFDLGGEDAEGAALTGMTTTFSLADGSKGVTFSAQSLTYKCLTINTLSGSIGENGITASAEGFTFTVGEKTFTGTLQDLTWRPGESVSVGSFTISSDDEIVINDNVKLSATTLGMSLVNGRFSFSGETTFSSDGLRCGLFAVSAEGLKAGLSLQQGAGGYTFGIGLMGKASFTVGTEGDVLASAELTDLTYRDGVFSVGEFSIGTTVEKLLAKDLTGGATFTTSGFTFTSGANASLNIDSMGLTLTELKYKDKEIVNCLSVNVILNESEPAVEEAAGTDAELALDDAQEDDEGELPNYKINVFLTDQRKGIEITANEYTFTRGNLTFNSKNFTGEFTSAGITISAEETSVSLDIPESLKIIPGLSALTFAAKGLSLGSGGIAVSEITATAELDAKIAGLSITKAQVGLTFDQNMGITGVTLGGSLALGNYLSGEASVLIDKDGTVTFGGISGVSVSYAGFTGSVEKIAKEGENLKFTNVTLKKNGDTEGAVSSEELGFDKNSLMAKCLGLIPNISLTISELTFENGEPKFPSADAVTISHFEKTFELGKDKDSQVSLVYDTGAFTASIQSGLNIPSEGDQPKRIPIVAVPVPIIPPNILQAVFSLGFSVKLASAIQASAKAEKTGTATDLEASLVAQGTLDAGVGGRLALELNTVVFNAEIGLNLGVNLHSGVDLTGGLGIKYVPGSDKHFSLNKEKTRFDFELKSTLTFDITLDAGAGIPAFMSGNKLYHSFNLFSYKIGESVITGSLAYSPQDGKYKFNADPSFKLGEDGYSPKMTEEEIQRFGGDLDGLKRNMTAISQIMKKVRDGANPDKGSLPEVSGEVGEMLEEDRKTLLEEAGERIDEVLRLSSKNAVECHELMAKLRTKIERDRVRYVENERNLKPLMKVLGDSTAALGITGYGEDDGTMTDAKYTEFLDSLERLKEDDAKLTELAMLDPIAVVNMFKTFKLDGAPRWNEIHGNATDMVKQQRISRFNAPKAKKNVDKKVYSTAMDSLSGIVKDTKTALDDQKKAVARAGKSLEAAKAAEQKSSSAIADIERELMVATDSRAIKSLKAKLEKERKAASKLKEAVYTAEADLNIELVKLDDLELQHSNKVGISSAMKGFDSFIAAEHNITTQNVEELKEYYIDTPNAPLDEAQITARKENVLKIIDALITSGRASDLATIFKPAEAGGSANTNIDRYQGRLKAVQEGENLVDVNVKAYGLSGNFNQSTFDNMKKTQAEFDAIQAQLQTVHTQLNEYHDVMAEALDQWTVVNGISYKDVTDPTAIADNSIKAVALIDSVDEADKKKVDDTFTQKVKEDANKLLAAK